MRRYAALDALRGCAAIVVVLGHIGQAMGSWQPPFFYLSVDLFFMLSGFVLAKRYDARFAEGLDALTFMKLRAIRLFPLAALGAALGILSQIANARHGLTLIQTVVSSVTSVAALPSCTKAPLGLLFPLNVPYWSLFLEVWVANLVFVLGWKWLKGASLSAMVVIAGLGLLGSQRYYHSMDLGWSWTSLPGGIFRVLYGFFVGVLIARQQRTDLREAWVGLFGVCALAAVVALTLAPMPGRTAQLAALIFLVAGLPLIVYLGSQSASGWMRFGERLGEASYALYVIHQPLILAFHDGAAALGFPPPWPVWRVYLSDVAIVGFLVVASLWLDRYYDRPLRARLLLGFPNEPSLRS